MKDILVPIDKAGRLVLPKNVRDQMDIQPGDMLKIVIHGNEVTLRSKKASSGLVRKGRALVFSSGGEILERETVDAILAREREGTVSDISARISTQKSQA